jgi:hypothetical protein
MTTKTQPSRSDLIELDRRYGKIGISAVAAAVRYQSAIKTDDRADDAALKMRCGNRD